MSCGACGWVRPLPPHVEQRSCPCGWTLDDANTTAIYGRQTYAADAPIIGVAGFPPVVLASSNVPAVALTGGTT